MKKILIITLIVLIIIVIIFGIIFGIYQISIHKLPANTKVAEQTTINNSSTNLNSKGESVIMEKVNFKNQENGFNLAGLLFKPENFDETKKYPAIVITGPMLSVKEQCQSIYAERMAKEGYVTMVFDYSYFGESEGEPRYLELPDIKASDIKAAVTYLSFLEFVDEGKIGGIGICGSGSYMPYGAISDERIKVVASVVPGTTMDTFIYKPLEEVAKDKEAYENGTAKPTYIDLMPRAFAEGAAYYYNKERGLRDNWSNMAVSWSEEGFAKFHPTQEISKLKVPYIVITGEDAWSKAGAKELYEKATSEKEYHEVKGAGHFDMYDLEPYVTENIEYISTFFAKYIK